MVTLGKKGRPLDTTEWDALCNARLGKTVLLGSKLSQAEWRVLGYFMAAGDAGSRKYYWIGMSNSL